MKAIKKVGWMDSTCFKYELGEALGGEKVYASEEDLRKHNECIDMPEQSLDGKPLCRAMRVYVFDADAFDLQMAKEPEQKGLTSGKKRI